MHRRVALAAPAVFSITAFSAIFSRLRSASSVCSLRFSSSSSLRRFSWLTSSPAYFDFRAPVLAIVLASSMANLRFLPMSLSLLPLFRDDPAAWRWRYLLVALMSVNTWALTLRHGPSLPPDQRAPYFIGLSFVCMTAGLAGTALGYHLAGTLPFFITASLIFLNPMYFVFLFAGVRHRNGILALIIGAVLGPLFHQVSPDWGLVFFGVTAGTAAYWLDRAIGGGDE